MKCVKKMTSVRFSPQTQYVLRKLGEMLGLTMAGVLERSVEKLYRSTLGDDPPPVSRCSVCSGVFLLSEPGWRDLGEGVMCAACVSKYAEMGRSICCLCGDEFLLSEEGWSEIDDGDLCPTCTQQAEEEAEGEAHLDEEEVEFRKLQDFDSRNGERDKRHMTCVTRQNQEFVYNNDISNNERGNDNENE